MGRILITGADGFTGRYLALALAAAGHDVHGITHQLLDQAIPGVSTTHVCDLADAAGLAAVVAKVKPSQVAHLAAIAFVAHGDADGIYRTNIVGTRNLLEALATSGLPVDMVLLASSANIYGNQVSGVIDESVPPGPINDYAVSKVAMEYVAKLYNERLPIVVCRPFNYTGVGQATNFLIPKIIDHVRRWAPVIELGNLEVARDFSDVRDVVAAYAALLATPAAIGGTFNICSGEAHSLQNVLDLAREISGHDFAVNVNPAFVRANEVKMLCGSRAKLDALVSAGPRYSLSDTVSWMLKA